MASKTRRAILKDVIEDWHRRARGELVLRTCAACDTGSCTSCFVYDICKSSERVRGYPKWEADDLDNARRCRNAFVVLCRLCRLWIESGYGELP